MDRHTAQARTLYLARHGSRAYGLDTPTRDTDYKGVLAPTKAQALGFTQQFEQFEAREPDDLVLYTLQKFFKLAEACNPSIIEVLFVDEGDVVSSSPEGDRLREARGLFLSQRAFGTFTGYAMSQLSRIQTHRGWLLNPPEGEPLREHYDLPPQPIVPKGQLGAAMTVIERQGTAGFDTNFLEMLDREKRWRAAHNNWKQYESWKRGRNPARAALEAQFGFDLKHATHLIRLLRMGEEIIARGDVIVRRHDREELMAIKEGRWSYDQLAEHAEALMARMKGLMHDRSALAVPEAPDTPALEALCVELMESALTRLG